jgi:hypothetical protein
MEDKKITEKILKNKQYCLNLPKTIQENYELEYFKNRFPKYKGELHLFLHKCNQIKHQDFRLIKKRYGEFYV